MTPELSAAALSVWAKSDRQSDGWMPLHRHMTDSAAVAAWLWDRWLPASVRDLIAGPVDAEEGRTLVSWLAAVHDLGKCSPAFASQVPELADRMRRAGLKMPSTVPNRGAAPHSLASLVLVRRWLEQEYGFQRLVAATYAMVPGGHHGVVPTARDIEDLDPRLAGTEAWLDTQRELAAFASDFTGASRYLATWRSRPLSAQAQILATAVVIVSDWIASSADHFPFEDTRDSHQRAVDAMAEIGLTGPWSPEPPDADIAELLRNRFQLPAGAVPRAVQQAAYDLAMSLEVPGLLCIEAEMGSGKTEAALAVAEVFAAKVHAGGVIVALPTMATSDAMFRRVQSWLNRVPEDGVVTTFLAHGKAALNADFEELQRLGRIVGVGSDEDPSSDMEGLVSVALQWLSGRKKGVLSSFVVGTIDQVLIGALRSRHLVLRHLALAGKVVVLDEVHAADEYMSVYLERVLSWLGSYGVPTILLSATLPKGRRKALIAAYDSGRRGLRTAADLDAPRYVALDRATGYPVVTASTASSPIVIEVPQGSDNKQIRIEQASDDDEKLLQVLRRYDGNHVCVAVIRNTVRRAQYTAGLLRTAFGDEVMLVHSQFLAVDRMRREAELRRLLGPPSPDTERPCRIIVVGTQVLEQSLDVDFDLLVSDMAPIDLLLQRIGRLHRHERPAAQRHPELREPRCVVVGVEDWGSTPQIPNRSSELVYSRSVMLRSMATLDRYLTATATLELPASIAPLVQTTYSADFEPPAGWGEELAKADREYKAAVAERRDNARQFLLGPVPKGQTPIYGWTSRSAGEAEEEARGRAQVRDGEDSIEVVVIQRIGGQRRVLPWIESFGGRPLPELDAPDWALARAISQCTIRLPYWIARGAKIDLLIKELERNGVASWQRSPWLRGQLVLELDQELTAELVGYRLTYQVDAGLTVTKLNGEY